VAELIVVTGGSYAGKTAVIDALAERGHAVTAESAIEIIEELNDELGVEGQIAWRRSHQADFQRRVSERQFERERRARALDVPHVFCDRGLLDGLAYCRMAGIDWPPALHAHAATTRYAHVFVLETLANFDPRAGTGRIDSREDSVRVAALLAELYEPRSDAVTVIPERPVAARVDVMLAACASFPETDPGGGPPPREDPM
jgi:predicted ATPase